MLGDDLATNFGIMLRAKHYSYHSAQAAQSWQGYYLNISPQTIALNRYDYGEQLLEIERVPDLTGSVHTLKIRMVGNVYTVELDGERLMQARDDHAFLSGQIGFFSSRGTFTIKSFSYKSL